ncbi:MAG: SRPBCC family protein [Nocardioides sp.]
MTTYSYEHTATTTATPAAVYARWADVATWPTWDTSVLAASLEGPFEPGSRGSMTLEGPMEVGFELVEVDPGAGFLDETVLPGLVLRFDHRVEARPGGAEVTVRVSIEGEGAAEMGPMVTGDTPDAVAGLLRLAERTPAPA